MSSRPSRYLKRDWNHKKPHLAKYSSLPTLQLTPTERPLFQCHQCGFINTLIPMCLWCCWTSDAAHDEFYRSAPRRRPRRLSAPPRVTTRTSSSDTPKSPASIPQNGEQYIPIPVEQQNTLYRGTDTTITTPVDNTPPGDEVTTPTISATTTPTGKGPQSHTRLRPSIPSFFLSQSDVDRPNPTTTTTGMKSINPKSSRFSLFLDFNSNHHNNGGRPDSTKKTLDDEPKLIGGAAAGAESPRTLRRKRRINIVEQAPQQLDVPRPAPIAISFDLELKEKEDESRISSDSDHHNSNALPQTPPPAQTPTSSPIRIGHPTRPYYTAIRKNMSSPPASPSSSPPPSRPTSLIASAPSRPTSLISAGEESFPPSSFHHHQQRPISLCLGGTAAGMFSPFVIDTNTMNTNAEESSGPTSTSKNTLPKPKTTERERGSIGFSMSGETELRMALAGIQAQTQTESPGEFRYRETMTTPSGSSGSGKQEGERRKRGGSMSGVVLRVKAFRKSLKDLIGGPKSAV